MCAVDSTDRIWHIQLPKDTQFINSHPGTRIIVLTSQSILLMAFVIHVQSLWISDTRYSS